MTHFRFLQNGFCFDFTRNLSRTGLCYVAIQGVFQNRAINSTVAVAEGGKEEIWNAQRRPEE